MMAGDLTHVSDLLDTSQDEDLTFLSTATLEPGEEDIDDLLPAPASVLFEELGDQRESLHGSESGSSAFGKWRGELISVNCVVNLRHVGNHNMI